jgi:hypothetical protein
LISSMSAAEGKQRPIWLLLKNKYLLSPLEIMRNNQDLCSTLTPVLAPGAVQVSALISNIKFGVICFSKPFRKHS